MVMGQKLQYVTIKGTKDGLTLLLNDTCSFSDLMKELEEKLTSTQKEQGDNPLIPVHIKVGYRYLHKHQEEQLRDLIRGKKNLVVDSIESKVMTKEDALEWKKDTEITSVTKIIRSGQILEVRGDLLLIGDVNPGGTIRAGGNIFVMGALRGIAHAGFNGDDQSVIAASVMKPSQLRIAETVSRAPDYSDNGNYDMECAFVDEESQKIVIDRIQVLAHLRPNLTRFERGM